MILIHTDALVGACKQVKQCYDSRKVLSKYIVAGALVRLRVVLFYIRSDAKVSFCVVFSESRFCHKMLLIQGGLAGATSAAAAF